MFADIPCACEYGSVCIPNTIQCTIRICVLTPVEVGVTFTQVSINSVIINQDVKTVVEVNTSIKRRIRGYPDTKRAEAEGLVTTTTTTTTTTTKIAHKSTLRDTRQWIIMQVNVAQRR
jgi:hypothetical protein